MRTVIGIHSCAETLKVRPKAIRKLQLREDWESSQELTAIAEVAKRNRIRIETASVGKLDKVGHGHQGVAIEVSENPEMDWDKFSKTHRSVIVGLDGLEDPQNLGAALRTSWLLNVDGILVPKDRSAPLSAVVNKIASGGAEHVPIEAHAQIATPLSDLKDRSYWIFGLSEKADKTLWQVEIPDKVVWVIGSEAKGMRPGTRKICDELVAVPQLVREASLNAATTLAVALSETGRQWFVRSGRSPRSD